jgi:5-hydroxyisourate hydrolase
LTKLRPQLIFMVGKLTGKLTGRLTTHVLDTAHGRPGHGITIALWQIDRDSGARTLMQEVVTNQDGRTDRPLLVDDACTVGTYELVFHVGAYFDRLLPDLPKPLFLDQIPIQFSIADASAHYHVPLLVSPWSYSTYRGS